jgi:hypothetical protein
VNVSHQPRTYYRYPGAPPVPPVAPPRKVRNWPWILGMVVLAVLILGAVAYATDPNASAGSSRDTPASGTSASRTPAPAAKPAGPARAMDGGVYQVGVDVWSGRYKTPGPPADDSIGWCYWARHSDDSGTIEAIIANGNIEGPGSVTVRRGEFVEVSGGCTWTRVG